MSSKTSALFSVLCVATLASAAPALAGDEAVSDFNIKVSGFGGSMNAGHAAEGFYGVAGSLTMPLEHHLGLQFDGAYNGDPGNHFYDLGAHLFWRDPGTGLLGLYAGMARQINNDHHQRVDRYGIEGESYWANMTFSGALGYEMGNNISGVYGNAKIDYYLTPNFMSSSGITYDAGLAYYSSRYEYQFSSDHELGLGIFVNSDWHASDTYQVLGGLRLTIGEPMTLRDRHRHQDPASYLNADILSTEQSEYQTCGPTEVLACPIERKIPPP